MEQINIKQDIMDLCDDFVAFWKQLKEEVELIAQDDNAKLVCKWNDYFVEHIDTVKKLQIVKARAEIVQEDIFKQL